MLKRGRAADELVSPQSDIVDMTKHSDPLIRRARGKSNLAVVGGSKLAISPDVVAGRSAPLLVGGP